MESSKYQPAGADKRRGEKRVILDRASVREALTTPDSIDGGNPLFSGLLAGFQAVVFGLLLVVVPVLTTAVISTTLVDQDFHFGSTLIVGLKLWILSSGGDIALDGQLVSLVPLGITVLLYLLAVVSVRRTLQATLSAAGVYVATFTALVTLVTAVLGESVHGVLRVLVTSIAVGLLSAYAAFRKRPDASGVLAQLRFAVAALPGWLRPVLGGAAVMVAAVFVFASFVALTWLMLGRESMASILAQWSLDGFSGVALGITQLVVLPNLVVWAASWLTGAGFQIGVDTVVSPHEVVLGPLPNLPLLGALPQSAAPQSFPLLFAAFLVVCGVLGGVYLARVDGELRWWAFLITPGVASVAAVFGLGLLFWLASGQIGGGPNLVFGVVGVRAVLLSAAWLVTGALVGFVLARPEPRRFAREKLRSGESDYAVASQSDDEPGS
jgi:hypothetical protein